MKMATQIKSMSKEGSDDILFESFEDQFPPEGWTIISNNTNNSVAQSDSRAHSGSYAARFTSF